jgi:CheY-like chemotaxis protein
MAFGTTSPQPWPQAGEAMSASPKGGASLAGRRVLVVEDEILVFMLIESILEDNGCKVLPAASRVAAALEAARSETIDAALLDVNVAGERVYPVAEVLRERGIPFIFLTGYGEGAIDPAFQGLRVLEKPFREGQLVEELTACLDGVMPPSSV